MKCAFAFAFALVVSVPIVGALAQDQVPDGCTAQPHRLLATYEALLPPVGHAKQRATPLLAEATCTQEMKKNCAVKGQICGVENGVAKCMDK
jgi:hypothetical protein